MKSKQLFSALIIGWGCSLILCCSLYCTAQTPYYMEPEFRNANSNWIFGRCIAPPAPPRVPGTPPPPPSADPDSALHIDFKTTPPSVSRKFFWVPMANPSMREATLAVSDPSNGNLLFYTEGIHVHNRHQAMMPNGSGLRGDDFITAAGYYNTGMQQGFCAIPVIGTHNRWYLFTLTTANTNTVRFESKLFYSIIDMSLDGGNGDIDPNYKNVPLDTLNTMFGEALTAIPGDNCDVWLITYDRMAIAYKAFHITEQGVDTMPVISPSITGLGVGNNLQATISFSPDRTKISLAHNYNDAILAGPNKGCVVAKFDIATGKVSDEIIITSADGGHSSAFSNDSKKLYLGSLITTNGRSLFTQYDLGVWDSLTIRQSRYVIDSVGNTGGYSYGIRRRDSQLLVMSGARRIGIVMQPDASGASCDFRKNYLEAAGITGTADTLINALSLGNDVILPIYHPLTSKSIDTILCSGSTLQLTSSTSSNSGYLWEDGSTEEVRHINSPGTYWVSYRENYCRPRADTFIVEEIQLNPSITISGYTLGTSSTYHTYQWLLNGEPIPGATESTYVVTENGEYTVVVSGDHSCVDTSDIYVVSNVNIDDISLIVEQIQIYPNPASNIIHIQSKTPVHATLSTIEGRSILQTNSATSLSVKDLPAGIYLLQLKNQDGIIVKVEKIIKE